MPAPTSDTAIQRPDLGVLAYEYLDGAPGSGFIGPLVMPVFEVVEQSAQFPVIPIEALLKIPNTKRAMRGYYNRSDWEFEEGFYATKENGWEEDIDDRERNLYRNKFDADLVATRRAVGIILRSQEKRIADKVFNTSNFTVHNVTNEWDDSANATPLDDVKTGKLAIRDACGMLPNTLIISYSTFEDLKRSDQIIDLIKYTFPGMEVSQMRSNHLASVFNLEQVLIGGAVYDSAKKGQDASVSNLWDNEYAMLTRTSASVDILDPCIGRTFLWTTESPEMTVVEEYRAENKRGDVIRVRHDTDERLLASLDENAAEKSKIYQAVSYLFGNITT